MLLKTQDKENDPDYILGRMIERALKTGTSNEETGSPIKWSDPTSYKGFACVISSDGYNYIAMASEIEPLIKGREIKLQSAPKRNYREAGRELFKYIDIIRK